MRLIRETVLPSEEVQFFEHPPTGLTFACTSDTDMLFYLPKCRAIKDDNLTCLKDFYIKAIVTNAPYNPSFKFMIISPTDVSKVKRMLAVSPYLSEPEIVISEDMFNHLYGLNK